ncbi:hypothetical protein BKA61DRAFT_3382 [Leptodontidium sp. MPI-SDFR-AT-0119]|nr:hypothetical protein BKA61DRAFT_3382 [Leptodontidium sp. MPI-SDFR-AT-0119]
MESGVLSPQQSDPDAAQITGSIHREILLSYRLLFGQSSKSRVLLSKILIQHKRSYQRVDPFLITLCAPLFKSNFFIQRRNVDLPSNIFPVSNLDVNNDFMESETHSARDDFPTFGPHLLALQRYNLRQQPSRVRYLWRDRRNPLQWYTFWAVLWVGGITIILGLLQIFKSAAQLYFSAHPSPAPT